MILSRILKQEFDLPLLLSVILATLFGIGAIYSATYNWEYGAAGSIYERQIIWSVIAACTLLLTLVVPPRYYYAFAYILYGASICLLVLVLLFGESRWFDLGPFHMQPSELAKIATILALARYLSTRNLDLDRPRSLFTSFLLVLLPAVLVFRQPDLGTALVFISVLLPMLYWAGMRPVVLFFLISPLLSVICAFHYAALVVLVLMIAAVIFLVRPGRLMTAAIVVVNLAVAVGAPYLWENKMHDYQRRRILTFLNPDMDKLGAGYQVMQSKVAIGSGGLNGKGYLQGTQTKLSFLPEQHTDFVFSVIGEEFGFLGAMLVLALFILIIWRAIHIAGLVKSRFSSLVAIGLAAMLTFHVFVNIGMTVGVVPVTGLPLPYFSYGGSQLVVNLILAGLLLNFYAYRHEYY
ncbi:MAG: rod shape-determining protein RodA [Gemmatimonadota bacterium]|nr:rod shape-determining protein RodA [Gemmatimonadota bacterium]